MAEMKPASKVIAKAMASNDKWIATYALPGIIPLKVNRDGKTLLFDTEEAAKTSACVALVEALQKRVIDDRKPAYLKK